jgi:multidrug efflux pump subunit AcrA (membrane-fusion protein)
MKKKIIIGAAALLIVLAGAGLASKYKSEDKKVRLEKIVMGDLEESLVFNGIIEPEETLPLYVEVPTVVDKFLVNEGSEVSAGDSLLEFSSGSKVALDRELQILDLDIKSIDLQMEDLDSGSMKLELDSKQLELKSLEEDIKGMNRSLKVVTFEAKTYRQQADVKMDLLKQQGVSSVEANASLSEANRKEMELEDLKTDLELSKQKYDLMILSYERLKRELNLQKSDMKGKQQKLALKREDIAEKLRTVEAPLKSPIDGVITGIYVNQGTPIPAGARLMEIAVSGNNRVKMEIPVYQAKWIVPGQKAIVTMRDSAEDAIYEGIIESVSKAAKLVKVGNYEDRIIEVEVSLENSKGLKPGYETTVEIAGNAKDQVKLVDSIAVMEENGKSYVYVYEGDTVKKTLVDIGAKTLSKYEVLNLPEGTEVVLNTYQVQDGDKAEVLED